ncbi:TOXD [Trichoderma harzianum]|uniref:TOXD n=1 Tax=Trichoderma harzianum TaxID=5544 RepID=A0A0F9XII4_TRIHA|nr:TOXD [Trichoderma harzianum]
MADSMQNYGLVRKSAGHAVLQPIPLPQLLDDYVLIRVVTVAINPTDWTTLEASGDDGTLVGCDWAGIVEKIGPAVTKDLRVGDRVAGCAHGGNDANPETGAFARYIISKGDLVVRIPDAVTWEEAATVAVALITVGLALYHFLGLPLPGTDEKPIQESESAAPIFIYGGSTATGTIAIQFAKLSGRKVLTTCSTKNSKLVTDRGADVVYDYHNPKVGEQVRADTQNQLTQVLDTVAIESTAAICSDAISTEGGTYVNLLGIEIPRLNVESIFFLGYSASGESYIFEGERWPAEPTYFAFGKEFLGIAEKLWSEGKLKTHPERVGPDGLLGAIAGMKEMKEGKVSGEKLVYRIDETAQN